jgi:trk system potassium uptake protein TrkA
MRIVFVGAGKLSISTARGLLHHGHEVVIIESEKERIEELSGEIDCGFLHGDGSKPAVLREAGPEHTDFLFCLTGSDQMNIIASLVGRSLGFTRVVTKIEDHELDHICSELGLEHTIIPTHTISRFLVDMVAGRDILELSTMIKGEARFFSFVAREEDEGTIEDLGLPGSARVICYYRDEKFAITNGKDKLRRGDEVIILTRSENMQTLRERFSPKVTRESAEDEEEPLETR